MGGLALLQSKLRRGIRKRPWPPHVWLAKARSPAPGPGGEGHGRSARTQGLAKTLGLARFLPGADSAHSFLRLLTAPEPDPGRTALQAKRRRWAGVRRGGARGEGHGPRSDVHTRGSDAWPVVPPAARDAGRAADDRGPRVRWADCDAGRRAVSPLPACNCLCPGGALVPEPCTLKASEAGGGSEEQVPSWEARPGDWAASSFLPPRNNHEGVRWERASEVDEPPHAT